MSKHIKILLICGFTAFCCHNLSAVDKQKKDEKFPIDGYIKIQYRARWTENLSPFNTLNSDQDLYEYLNVNLGDPEKNKITASIFGRVSQDLDGTKDVQGYYIFDSITDTYNSSLNLRLYNAHIDINSFWLFEKIRIGRQSLYDTPVTLYIDGAFVETKPIDKIGNLYLGIYGGIPTELYRASVSGSAVLGMYAAWQFLPSNKMRLDWTFMRDKSILFLSNNNLFGISFWQNIGEHLQFYTQSTILGSALRDITFRGTYTNLSKDFWISGYFKRLNETQKQQAIQFDPYFSIAQELVPYNQYQIDIHKGFGDKFSIGTGATIRTLNNINQETRFNHEFRRFYLTPIYHIRALPTDFSITLDFWDGAGNNDVKTIGLDITSYPIKKFKASIGTFYSLYKYDYIFDTERQNVRTYYIKSSYKLKDHIKIDWGFEFENAQKLSIYTLNLGVKYEF